MNNAERKRISRAEQDCNILWGTCVKIRDRWCIICGETGDNHQAHHLFLKAQGNWVVIYDIDFGIRVCKKHHAVIQATPYGELFEKAVNYIRNHSDRIMWGHLAEWGRADKILVYKNSIKKPCTIKPDYQGLKKLLTEKQKEIQEQAWMDADCVPGYGDPR